MNGPYQSHIKLSKLHVTHCRSVGLYTSDTVSIHVCESSSAIKFVSMCMAEVAGHIYLGDAIFC